jgi:RNAse (barnase) inhibitor barstar
MEGGPYVGLKTDAIYDWTSFHAECQRAFGFPAFYGRNMEAWVDCMSSLRSDDGLLSIRLPAGELLELELTDTDALRERVPDLIEGLVLATAEVNQRFIENGEAPAIALIFS